MAFIAKSGKKAPLQPSHAVVHVGPHRHEKLCFAVAVSAQLNSHQLEEGVGIPSFPANFFQIAHFHQLLVP